MSTSPLRGLRSAPFLAFLLAAFVLVGCDSPEADITGALEPEVTMEIGALPETVPAPADNPVSVAKRDLGQLLFWDPVLSGTMDVACATCHHPDHGYADGMIVSQGVFGIGLGPQRTGGNATERNSPSVLNTGFNGLLQDGSVDPASAPMFWDLRAEGLEEQALQPILNGDEMRGPHIAENAIMDTVLTRLAQYPEYVDRFTDAFGTPGITENRLAQAISAYERTLVSNNSRFDRYMRGELTALNNQEIQGMNAFIEVGCADCHSGPMFSDFEVHTLGVPEAFDGMDDGATGRFDFRTPTLRNITLTGPYMHNGVFDSLDDVLDFYEDISDGDDDDLNQFVSFANLDPEMRDLSLNGNQINEIIAFLRTLTDENFDRSRPATVPSGLSPGGSL